MVKGIIIVHLHFERFNLAFLPLRYNFKWSTAVHYSEKHTNGSLKVYIVLEFFNGFLFFKKRPPPVFRCIS